MYAGQSKNPRMFIGHKNLGGKTLLYLIDGTYGSRDVNGKPSPKWQKAPFNSEWACSIIASQDPLVVDAVAMPIARRLPTARCLAKAMSGCRALIRARVPTHRSMFRGISISQRYLN